MTRDKMIEVMADEPLAEKAAETIELLVLLVRSLPYDGMTLLARHSLEVTLADARRLAALLRGG
jgi:hypothetical protein